MAKENKMMQRRRFIGNISKAGLLGGLLVSSTGSIANEIEALAAHPGEGHIFLVNPYLQAPEPDSMRVMWITNKLCYSWVEYGEGAELTQKAHETTNGLINAYNRVNCVQLNGLKPGASYRYRVVSKEILDFEPYELKYGETITSDTFTFQTPDPKVKEVSWLVMNDIHDRPASIPHLMKLAGNDAYDFVFFNGDMFDYQTDEEQIIRHMLAPCADVFASRIPFLFVRGNHETRGKFARNLTDYFSNPGQRYYYSFVRGPVHAIVLDTGEDKPDSAPVYAGIVDFDAYRKEQAVWLEKEMQTLAFKKAKFRVVMMHIPHYYSGDWHGTLHCRELYAPLFDKYKIDFFIAGHTHRYGVFNPVKGQHNYPVIIGGGPTEGKRTIMKIKANEQVLQLSMLKDDGTEVGKYEIKSKR
ncbi:metallophosphoesterase family protein [Agriterribacter sp.]|uniref:metallophosphoesterase family protein n=1 Tax=Agriterribacter sp. TaxID=2821509 RepID=UPI002CCD8F67|nr:metallophosphoesterase family protein [Agriterribacter sp.]HTN06264.1 metallophosphoesterase family protein [Agriterribacter sp.]